MLAVKRDPRSGRILTDSPFAAWWPASTVMTVRMAPAVVAALKIVARQRGVTVSNVILSALHPVLLPVLRESYLADQASAPHPAQPATLPRLADQLPAPVSAPIPELGHRGRRSSFKPSPKATLADRR